MHGYKAKFRIISEHNNATCPIHSPLPFSPLSTYPVFVSGSLFLPENFLRKRNSFLIQITEKKEVDLMSSSIV